MSDGDNGFGTWVEELYVRYHELTDEEGRLKQEYSRVAAERADVVRRLNQLGQTYETIGKRVGISTPRAAQLGIKALRSRFAAREL